MYHDQPTLMTLHVTKDLEFYTVFLSAFKEGIITHARCFLKIGARRPREKATIKIHENLSS